MSITAQLSPFFKPAPVPCSLGANNYRATKTALPARSRLPIHGAYSGSHDFALTPKENCSVQFSLALENRMSQS
jgi:hypothetical protein